MMKNFNDFNNAELEEVNHFINEQKLKHNAIDGNIGILSFYNPIGRWGTIYRGSKFDLLYVSARDLVTNKKERIYLDVGELLIFEVGVGQKGLRATNITRIKEANLFKLFNK